MRTTKTLKPGQKGTKELLARFGPSLLYVRYREGEAHREHVKTVEFVVQRRSQDAEAECSEGPTVGARKPDAGRRGAGKPDAGRPDAGRRGALAGESTVRRVALRIGWRERDLQHRVKSAGGRWDPTRRVWLLRRDVAERLDLMSRVVGGGG